MIVLIFSFLYFFKLSAKVQNKDDIKCIFSNIVKKSPFSSHFSPPTPFLPSRLHPRLHPRPVSIPVLYVALLTQLLPHLPLYSIILFFAEKTDIRPKSESHSIDHLRQPQKRGCPCLSGGGRKRSYHLHHKALRCHRCPHTSSPSFCCHRQRIGCPRACPI